MPVPLDVDLHQPPLAVREAPGLPRRIGALGALPVPASVGGLAVLWAVATILVDRNERFPELQGAMFQGRAVVLEDADAENGDSHLEEARMQMGAKYAGGHGESDAAPRRNAATARGRSGRWVRFEPAKLVTWDNYKIKPRG